MSIEVGSKLQGKVTGITNFGAFVELPGGSTGLVHISEVADNYVKDINEFLKVGDEVEVKVLNVESDGKIGLSIRKAKDNPPPERRPQKKGPRGGNNRPQRAVSFEDKMNRFLKDSEERLASLKRNTESKRGGKSSKRG
ncbi:MULTISPECIES: S1 domain-containing RNA-binding protein [Bacillaceae]|uniref:RNA-binding protein S1 n=1 Tax=Evansella alkalicola TaxID=745819 RepID=A0ABS6JTU6_9BACI|nr:MULTISPECIES: S1 domain-containing RNA-binding protein [Bacillaceae]MBU9722006.1 RNA-binding protein S1 [Bacillus alkalicola]